MVHLGHHHGLDVRTGCFCHFQKIPVTERGVQSVDSNGDGDALSVQSMDELNDQGAGRYFGPHGNAVFQVEHDHIDVSLRRLDMHLFNMSGNGKCRFGLVS